MGGAALDADIQLHRAGSDCLAYGTSCRGGELPNRVPEQITSTRQKVFLYEIFRNMRLKAA